MLTQPVEPINTPNYDPLSVQFMTGGNQMAYMPQAQFLTPSEYGAFRTMPNPMQHPGIGQEPGFFQSMLIANQGYLPFGIGGKYLFNTYNPAMDQQLYMAQHKRHLLDQMVAGGGILGELGIGMAAGAFGTSVGGPLAGIAAGIVAPMLLSSDHFQDRLRDMRAVQNLTMAKVVGGKEVNAATGMGFNASAARDIDSFVRIQSAGDAVFKDGDYRDMLKLGVESGMFDQAQNAEQYKRILKSLRNSMSTLMQVVGSSDFKDIFKEMKRLQSMGGDISQFERISRQENMFSRITGLSHKDMVNTYGQQGAMIYQQAGLNAYQGSTQAMADAATVAMGRRMGIISNATLARNGGESGMAQKMTTASANAQNQLKDILLPYAMNDDMTGLREDLDLNSLLTDPNFMEKLNSGAARLADPDKMMAYRQNRDEIWGKLNDRYGTDNVLLAGAHLVGRQSGMKDEKATNFGLQALGLPAELAAIKTNAAYSQDLRDQREREAAKRRKDSREQFDVQNNWLRKVMLGVSTGWNMLGESTWGRLTGAYADWAQERETAAAGMIDNRMSMSGSDTSRNLALINGGGGSGGDGGSYGGPISVDVNGRNTSIDAAGWRSKVTTRAEANDFFERTKETTLHESGGRMDLVNMPVKQLADGRFAMDGGKKSNHWDPDSGGASYGLIQMNWGNMKDSMKTNPHFKKFADYLKNTYNIDVNDTSKGSAMWHINNMMLDVKAGKWDAVNANQEGLKHLNNFNKAWKYAVSDESGMQDDLYIGMANFSKSKDLRTFLGDVDKNGSDLLKNLVNEDSGFAEGFRRIFYSMANGSPALMRRRMDEAFQLKGITKERLERARKDPKEHARLIDDFYDGIIEVVENDARTGKVNGVRLDVYNGRYGRDKSEGGTAKNSERKEKRNLALSLRDENIKVTDQGRKELERRENEKKGAASLDAKLKESSQEIDDFLSDTARKLGVSIPHHSVMKNAVALSGSSENKTISVARMLEKAVGLGEKNINAQDIEQSINEESRLKISNLGDSLEFRTGMHGVIAKLVNKKMEGRSEEEKKKARDAIQNLVENDPQFGSVFMAATLQVKGTDKSDVSAFSGEVEKREIAFQQAKAKYLNDKKKEYSAENHVGAYFFGIDSEDKKKLSGMIEGGSSAYSEVAKLSELKSLWWKARDNKDMQGVLQGHMENIGRKFGWSDSVIKDFISAESVEDFKEKHGKDAFSRGRNGIGTGVDDKGLTEAISIGKKIGTNDSHYNSIVSIARARGGNYESAIDQFGGMQAMKGQMGFAPDNMIVTGVAGMQMTLNELQRNGYDIRKEDVQNEKSLQTFLKQAKGSGDKDAVELFTAAINAVRQGKQVDPDILTSYVLKSGSKDAGRNMGGDEKGSEVQLPGTPGGAGQPGNLPGGEGLATERLNGTLNGLDRSIARLVDWLNTHR